MTEWGRVIQAEEELLIVKFPSDQLLSYRPRHIRGSQGKTKYHQPSCLVSLWRGMSGQHPSMGMPHPVSQSASTGWISLCVVLPVLEGANTETSLIPSP